MHCDWLELRVVGLDSCQQVDVSREVSDLSVAPDGSELALVWNRSRPVRLPSRFTLIAMIRDALGVSRYTVFGGCSVLASGTTAHGFMTRVGVRVTSEITPSTWVEFHDVKS